MIDSPSGPSAARGFGSRLRILAIGRNPRRTLLRAAILAVVCVVVFKFALLPVRVAGISMAPTYADRSFNFINRLAFLWREPRRGDVVGIRLTPPDGLSAPHIAFMKRVVGLPGETVSFVNGRLVIDGRTLEEPYEKGPCDWNLAPEKLGPEEYFVVGDNRTMPRQEHKFGRVERARIAGKVLL
jgi:signal peptidase I